MEKKRERLYNRLNRYKLEYYSKRILKNKKVRDLTSETWLVPILIPISIDRSPLNIHSTLNERSSLSFKSIFNENLREG